MSKSKKKIAKKTAKNKQSPAKSRIKKSRIVALIIICAAVLAVVIVAVAVNAFSSAKKSQLCGYEWKSASALNASGDEADMGEVYNVNYSAYQGSLNFKDDGTFSIWLSPGAADDGTHTGTYSFTDDSKIDVVFDEGTVTSFEVNRKADEIESIVVNYNDYEVYFTKP